MPENATANNQNRNSDALTARIAELESQLVAFQSRIDKLESQLNDVGKKHEQAIVYPPDSDIPIRITTRELNLVDRDGSTRGLFVAGDDRVFLNMLDSNGVIRMSIEADTEFGTDFTITDENNKPRLHLGHLVDPKPFCGFEVYDAERNLRLEAAYKENSETVIQVQGKKYLSGAGVHERNDKAVIFLLRRGRPEIVHGPQ